MSINSTKSLALFISNNSITYLTKTQQNDDVFYSDMVTFKIPDLDGNATYDQLEKEFKSRLALLLYYNQISVCLLSTPVAVIPNTYFSEELNAFIESASTKVNPKSIPLENLDAQLVYNYYPQLEQLLSNLSNFNNYTITHTGSFIIQQNELNQEKDQVFLQLIDQKLELCIYKKGNFAFYNVFNILSSTDVLYYTLNVMNQLELDQIATDVHIQGGIAKEDEAANELIKYIRNVSFDHEDETPSLKQLLYKIFECELYQDH